MLDILLTFIFVYFIFKAPHRRKTSCPSQPSNIHCEVAFAPETVGMSVVDLIVFLLSIFYVPYVSNM